MGATQTDRGRRDYGGGETTPLSRRVIDDQRAALETHPTLVVSHADGAQAARLTPGRPVVVGREAPSDLVVLSAFLSRCHARVTLIDGLLQVEDLGSQNGTVVAGARVERATLRPGEAALLGRVRISLQHLDGEASGASLPGHEHFRGWLEVELARARHFHRGFAVLHLRSEVHLAEGWLPFLRGLLRPVDRVALYAPSAAWALLPEVSAEEAKVQGFALARARHELGPFLVGVASYPEAASVDQLLDDARSAARRARVDRPVVSAVDAPSQPGPRATSRPVIGASPAMREAITLLERVASSTIPVLLLGETGSGKEVAATLLHQRGPRARMPMIPVNCGAIPAHLLESTLFGHEKGAFTGALALQKGVFESADGGTVFLDEVGELPANAQAALLRVLETKRVCRVGSTRELPVDVRIVAATHRDLEAMIALGQFRQDLLFRLETMTITLPPLRARKEDIPPLVEAMLTEIAAPATASRISAEAMAILLAYEWPGNVRELRNAIDRAAAIAVGPEIGPEDLPERVLRGAGASASAPPVSAAPASLQLGSPEEEETTLDLRSRLARFEASLIVAALREVGGHQGRAAEKLGLPLRTLKHKLASLGIRRESYVAPSATSPRA